MSARLNRTALLLLAGALAAGAHGESANALIRLLNSRSSGSPRGYAQAAEEVAVDAKAGRPLQGYVLAIVSRDDENPPPAARLDEKTREAYLTATRGKIERLALKTNNSLAWYLLSLDKGDTNLLQRAAEGGNVQALNAWGSFIVTRVLNTTADTNEIKRVFGIAFDCFKKAAGEGDANGLYNLGSAHARGIGTPRNDQSAFSCFRAAAEKGHPEAMNNIGWFFREGRVVPRDYELSTKWFEKSADYDNAFGQYNYALALRRGEGVEKNLERAAEYLVKASDGGCVEAVNTLGLAYLNGEGLEEDRKKAFQLFLKAADANYPPAMENISTCYARGWGVTPDERAATEWKIRSRAARGDRNAARWLQKNAKKGR